MNPKNSLGAAGRTRRLPHGEGLAHLTHTPSGWFASRTGRRPAKCGPVESARAALLGINLDPESWAPKTETQMDPNVTWRELLMSLDEGDFITAAVTASNLNSWLLKGGFPPNGFESVGQRARLAGVCTFVMALGGAI